MIYVERGEIMLEKVDLKRKVSKEDYKAQIGTLKQELTDLDGPIKEAGMPVIILFEGWGGAGKGNIISKLILNFDPRWFKVENTQQPTPAELREPSMWRYWQNIPAAGQMSIMDRSWYQEVSALRIEGHIDDLTNVRHMNEINSFERGLTENGYHIIKFFIHITQKEQKKECRNLPVIRVLRGEFRIWIGREIRIMISGLMYLNRHLSILIQHMPHGMSYPEWMSTHVSSMFLQQ